MQMMLLFENGRRVEALLLAADADRMRVVVPGLRDALELRLIEDQWMTEEGDAVDIELMMVACESSVRSAHWHHAA